MTDSSTQRIKIRDSEFTANVRISQTVSFVSIPCGDSPAQIIPAYSATWEITAKDQNQRPAKGDMMIASDGTEWHIQKVTMVTHRNVWQCLAYTPMTGFLPHDTVNILRPSAAMSENGMTTMVWRRIKSNLSAKLTSEKQLRAYTREHLLLQKNDLLELPDGRQYKIVRTRHSRPTHGWTEMFLKINPNPVVISIP